jgi:hypothetical protein
VKLSGQFPISLWNLRTGRFATDAQNWKLHHQCNKTIIELYYIIKVTYGWDWRNPNALHWKDFHNVEIGEIKILYKT